MMVMRYLQNDTYYLMSVTLIPSSQDTLFQYFPWHFAIYTTHLVFWVCFHSSVCVLFSGAARTISHTTPSRWHTTHTHTFCSWQYIRFCYAMQNMMDGILANLTIDSWIVLTDWGGMDGYSILHLPLHYISGYSIVISQGLKYVHVFTCSSLSFCGYYVI